TFVSYNYEETCSQIEKLDYPVISKLITGSGSYGVELVKDATQAVKLAKQAFSPRGRSTYWPYIRQKDYVYFQKFVEKDSYDVRILVIGDDAFGYYRKAPKGDYRASGM